MHPLLTDSYKLSHWKQYPPGTTGVYSYFESRGGKWDETVFFGLQHMLKKYLRTYTEDFEVLDAFRMAEAHGVPFNMAGWMHILKDHKGYLPISIKAVPEGTIVPTSNVLMTVENTCPYCYWVTNYVETLLVQCWYPTTVATLSRQAKKVILRYLERTGDPAGIDFKLHDFGFRGVSSVESAAIGGAAHLVNFKGTDTLTAPQLCREYYDEPCAGYSIPASEHSTITSWGKEHEVDAFENMLDQYPSGLVACVSDSFDIYKACGQYWGGRLREKILARNGTLVVRPDSGYPPHIVRAVVSTLAEAFGFSTNAKGYKVLDPHVRVIQGDGVDLDMIENVLHTLQASGWSTDNVAFGMGGGLLQQVNRDTLKFAFKCSSVRINDKPVSTAEAWGKTNLGEWRDVWKDPITDKGKMSKRGKLALAQVGGTLQTVAAPYEADKLVEVFRDGKVLVNHTLADIRERAKLT